MQLKGKIQKMNLPPASMYIEFQLHFQHTSASKIKQKRGQKSDQCVFYIFGDVFSITDTEASKGRKSFKRETILQ